MKDTKGTKIEAFPFLESEGYPMRRDEVGDWTGIRASAINREQVASEIILVPGQ